MILKISSTHRGQHAKFRSFTSNGRYRHAHIYVWKCGRTDNRTAGMKELLQHSMDKCADLAIFLPLPIWNTFLIIKRKIADYYIYGLSRK